MSSFSPLKNQVFRSLWIATVISNIGHWRHGRLYTRLFVSFLLLAWTRDSHDCSRLASHRPGIGRQGRVAQRHRAQRYGH
ncbi:MAG: MFS transporter [Opitutales bacterium]|nr:MFS transporter [Opitutales bacterium]